MNTLPTSPPGVPRAAGDEPSATGTATPLIITVHHPRPGHVLVRAHGELDLVTADDLRGALDRTDRADPAAGAGPDHVVCDLGGVTFLAAAGLGALAEAGSTIRRRGGHLLLIASTRHVRRVLALSGLGRELTIAPRLLGALEQEAAEVLDASRSGS